MTTHERRATPIVALDYPDAPTALDLVERLGDRCGFYKVGSELFTAAGPLVVRELVMRGRRVFLDLKFHDIPNTVAHGVTAAANLGASIVTVHASGGTRMVRAAVEAAGDAAGSCEVFAVTVLTSLAPADVAEAWGRPPIGDLEADVVRLADLARDAGAAGVVCSGYEAEALHRRFGAELQLLVPGIRLPGGAAGDQTRIVTPRQAADAGASYLILGRAVTAAPDPVAAMDEVVASLG